MSDVKTVPKSQKLTSGQQKHFFTFLKNALPTDSAEAVLKGIEKDVYWRHLCPLVYACTLQSFAFCVLYQFGAFFHEAIAALLPIDVMNIMMSTSLTWLDNLTCNF